MPFKTVDGTAVGNGKDYSNVSGTIEFLDGQTECVFFACSMLLSQLTQCFRLLKFLRIYQCLVEMYGPSMYKTSWFSRSLHPYL